MVPRRAGHDQVLGRDNRRPRRRDRASRAAGRRFTAARPPQRRRVVLRHQRQAGLLGRRPSDQAARRVVRVRPARQSRTFEVTSPEARFLLVAEPAGFENFMRELSEPAQSLTLPPASVQPFDPVRLMATAAGYGIEIRSPARPASPPELKPVTRSALGPRTRALRVRPVGWFGPPRTGRLASIASSPHAASDANRSANERLTTRRHRTSLTPLPTGPDAVQDGRSNTRPHYPTSRSGAS